MGRPILLLRQYVPPYCTRQALLEKLGLRNITPTTTDLYSTVLPALRSNTVLILVV